MDQAGKSKTEMTTLGIGNKMAEKQMQEKLSEVARGIDKESEDPVSCTSSDGMKSKQPPDPEISPTSGVTPNLEISCLKMSDRKVEKTKQETSLENRDGYEGAQEQVACLSSDGFKAELPIHSESSPTSDADMCGYEESEKPMPCMSPDVFYAERLPAPERCTTSRSIQNIEMTYLHKANETEEKYLEIVDDVKKMKANVDMGGYKESEKPVPSRSSDGLNVEWPFAPESALGSTMNINIKMTYMHKKSKEKVERCQYMTIDDCTERKEDLGRYEALSVPCTSAAGGIEWSPARERTTSAAETVINTDEDYDDVMIENENSDQDEYEEPDEAHSGRQQVSPPGCYEEPDVISSEQLHTPGSNRSPSGTPATTSVYQELK